MIYWVILLFVAGMALILAEFILPGAVLGVLGAIALIISTGLGVVFYPDYAIFIVALEVVGACLGIALGIWILARTKAGRALTLEHSQRAEDGYSNMASDETLLNAVGEAFTALRPAGTIMIDGRRVDAVSNGAFLVKGARVRVVEVHGNRVVVEAEDA